MSSPIWLIATVALILGILIGAALNEHWYHATPADTHREPVGREWGEISRAAADAARAATRQQIERWPDSEAKERYLRLHDADLTRGMRPRLIVTSDRIPAGAPAMLVGDDGLEAMLGVDRETVLKALQNPGS